jgi:type II secretory pathway pseudopilin PulG
MRAKHRQSGFALLLFMVVMIGFITAGVSGFLSSSVKQKNEQAKIKTQQALLKAKEALLSYALDYRVEDKGPPSGVPDGKVDFYRMGRLPCPDAGSAGTEGNQDPGCGAQGVNAIGLLPFKSVGLGKIEDASGECLWYVVSGDYKNSVSAEMLNRDSVGYLNVVDENGNLRHGANEDEFPIALIISPGGALDGQDRTPDAALPECKANFTVSNYLEGGVNIDYTTDHPATADTLWRFLTTSESAYLDNSDHNDQVIAIYPHELWDRISAMKDLEADNSAGVAPSSPIENLTKSLAECIAAYGNADAQRRLPYPAPLNLIDYRNNANYDDVPTNYGRFPQVVDSSIVNHAKFVLDTSGSSYCEGVVTTAYDELLWKNWKDHFFYWVSKDFDPATPTNADSNKCTAANGCFTVDSKVDKVAAMVVYARNVEIGRDRIWSWDGVAGVLDVDDKRFPVNYLEGGNQIPYTGTGATQNYDSNQSDYTWCIEYDNSSFLLSVVKCRDLDNSL